MANKPNAPINLLLSEHDDNKLFHHLVLGFLLATVIFTFVVSIVDVPELTREEKEKIPPQLVKIMERKVEVEPPEPEPVPEIEPEVVPEEAPEPEPEPEPVAEEKKPEPKPEPEPVEVEKKAREKAQKSGLLALADELSAMRETVDVNSLAETDLVAGAGSEDNTERMLLGKVVSGTSGGVNQATLSADVGSGTELEGRKTTEFVARVAGPNSDGADIADLSESEIASGSRSTESIRKTFDRNKSALYSIYRRALRSDASLQGQVTISIIILPNGSVQSVNIVSSEIDYPDFERKLLNRIKLINFGDEDVNETQLNYTFNFLPF